MRVDTSEYIPPQLQNKEFRFCLLKKRDKLPIEAAWQRGDITFDSQKLAKHLEAGGNYGVIGGYGRLRLLDIDRPEDVGKIKLRTFSVKTGKGGRHFYFLSDYDRNHVLPGGVGELRANMQFVVGPGCTHPNGSTYEVIDDLPISEVTENQLVEILEPVFKERPLRKTDYAKMLQGEASPGERNDGYFRTACLMRFQRIPLETTRETLTAANLKNKQPITQAEMDRLIRNAYRYPNPERAILDMQSKDFADIWVTSREKTEEGKEYLFYKIDPDKATKTLLERFNFILVGEKLPSLYFYDGGIFLPGGEDFIALTLQKWVDGFPEAHSRLSKHNVAEVIAQVQRSVPRANDLTDEPTLLCVENGILDLNTKELSPHSPEIVFFQKIRHKFEPKAKCPKTKVFFSELLREDDVSAMQEFIGSCLYRTYSFKKAAVLLGPPDTGKSSFIKRIVAFLGEQNVSGESLHRIVADKFSAINLRNRLLNAFDDLSASDIEDSGAFKVVTGDGFVTGEKKFGERVIFRNYAKLLFATNRISWLSVDDEAYFNRWLVFIFDKIQERPDRSLMQKLDSPEENSGFLNWALEGLDRLRKNNGFSYRLDGTGVQTLMERSSNSVAAFAQDCLIRKDGKFIQKEMIFIAYGLYCLKMGLPRETKEALGRTLPKVAPYILEGQREIEGKKKHCWVNVDLKDEKGKNDYNPYSTTQEKNLGGSSTFHKYEFQKRGDSHAQKKTLKELILKFVERNEGQEGCTTELILSKFPGDPELGERAILDLKENGDIFEKRPGFWKVL